VGLSEVSAATLRRAHAVHPIAAVQTEYSLWTRNPEIAVLDACRELGVAFVAFSPVARGFLTGTLRDVAALDAKDIRRTMPRFEPSAAYAGQPEAAAAYEALAREPGCTPRSWRWPGCCTRRRTSWKSHPRHHEHLAAAGRAIDNMVGPRYNPAAAGMDTEDSATA
jgi:hypothetical protein